MLIAPAAADILNILFPGAGIPVVMALLGALTLWAGITSWGRNQRAGLHEGHPKAGTASPPAEHSSADGQ